MSLIDEAIQALAHCRRTDKPP